MFERLGYLKKIDENLFNLSGDVPLTHCEAEYFRMGAAIVRELKYKYLENIILKKIIAISVILLDIISVVLINCSTKI